VSDLVRSRVEPPCKIVRTEFEESYAVKISPKPPVSQCGAGALAGSEAVKKSRVARAGGACGARWRSEEEAM